MKKQAFSRAYVSRFIMVLLALIVLAGAVSPNAKAEEGGTALTLSAPSKHRPYDKDGLLLNIPFSGSLSLTALCGSEELLLLRPTEVIAGPLSLPFWGLTDNGEPLPRGQAKLVAKLSREGEEQTADADILIQTPAAGLMYAILSREVLPREGGEDLYVDYQLGKSGYLLVNLYKAEDLENPLFTRTLNRMDALPHSYRWDRTIKGEPAPAGDYVFTFEAKGSKQDKLSRRFTLTEGEAETFALLDTEKGLFLPTAMDDESVWAAMMAPIARITIGAISHQKVYEEADSASQVLGMMHGQSAGVLVLENDVNGYARVRVARHGDGQWITGYIPREKIEVVRPADTFGLLIDKAAQRMSLYRDGKKVTTLKISTGIYVPPGTDSFDTVPGAFLTRERIAEFPSEGYRYLYATRIDGGNLLHSSGYVRRQGGQDFLSHQEKLGEKASHGCVRIDNRANEDGYNAWWLYANLPRNTKVLVLPENWAEEGALHALYDPGELPLIADAPSAAATPVSPEPVSGIEQSPESALSQLEAAPAETENQSDPEIPSEVEASPQPEAGPGFLVDDLGEDSAAPADLPITSFVTLTFGGDSILGSEERQRKLPESFDSVINEKGLDWPFSGLYDIFSRDDLSMVNLEGVLKDDAGGLDRRIHNFRGPEAFAGILTKGSIEAVNIANNHFPDYGQDGKNSTRSALSRENIRIAGYSDLFMFEKDGVKIGFGGIRETIYKQDNRRIEREIKALLDMGCQYVVYTCHFGNEYEEKHNSMQTRMAYEAVDAGANLVIGHHPHIVQGIEEYKGGLIFYSLGNLVFGGNLEMSTFDALLAQIRLDFSGDRLVKTSVRLIPILTSGARPQNDFRPVVALGEDKERILSALRADSLHPYEESFVIPGK